MRSTKFFRVVIALAVIACGSSGDDICGNLGSALNGFITKATPCTQQPPVIPFTAAQCNAALAHCTDADKNLIKGLTNCLNALPTCTIPTQQAWATQVAACANNAATLSPNCR